MGFAGRLASRFLHSKLTPLVTVAALAVGLLGILATPREEEPQISVPMIDVIEALPGATPAEVDLLLTRPIEQRMWEIPAVEHVYSMAGEGYTLVTVRFKVGEDQERSVTRVHAKLLADSDRMPPGALPPLVKPHSIDDVPILTLTVASTRYGSNELRQMATQLEDEIRTVPDVAETSVIGGQPRQIRVDLDPARLAAAGVTPGEVALALKGANARLEAGELTSAGSVYRVQVGAALADAAEVAGVVVSSRGGSAVYLRNVAKVREEFGERSDYVTYATPDSGAASAVTISIAKRKGANATDVARRVLERVEQARSRLLPADVTVAETRNYGETAREKASELIQHLGIATISVTLLIGLFLGWREAVVVLVAVPVTLALTLFSYYALGYTLNRITLFALIFSIGILVDDAIVVVENIYRHIAMGGKDPAEAAVEGVDEVGNPTILATFTVIAAILPMAFVRGLMGPYMRPIPVGASVAMLASLAVAFVITPYLAYRLLKGHVKPSEGRPETVAETSGTGFSRFYTRLMSSLMDRPRRRRLFYGGVVVLLLLSMGLVGARVVQVKMLPFDNKSEFQVILDPPEGTTLESSAALGAEVSAYLRTVPEVRNTQVYAGTAAPFNFNGLVRHYFMRRGPNVADVQVNLVGKAERSRQSHAIAVAVRPAIDSIARRYRASAKIAEIPPGPPVLSTLVAEVYAGTDSARLAAATRVKQVFEATPGVVDVDWTVESPQARLAFRIDRARAAAAGVSVEQIVQTVYLAESGSPAGRIASGTAREGIAIVPRLPLTQRSTAEALLAIPVPTDDWSRAARAVRRGRLDTPGSGAIPPRPPPCDLRDRRCGGKHREPGLRDPRHEPRPGHDPGGGHADPALQRGAARPAGRDRDQVGWRVADHHRGLPRPRPRLRGGAAADLCAGGLVVRIVQHPAGHHGSDSAHPDRHPAGPCADRGLLHRNQHDRNDRPGRNHRAQLDSAGRLHSPGGGARRAAASGRDRGGRGTLPAHCPHCGRGGRRRTGHGAGSDFSGTGRGADERRHRGDAAHDGGRAPLVLGAATARVVGFFNLERFICATRWSFAELPAHSFWAPSPSGGG